MKPLPEILDGHWATTAGLDMAQRYAVMTRQQLGHADRTDMEVAYDVAMLMRSDLDFEPRLSMAKDRIRWLSVQLAIALAQHEEAEQDAHELTKGLTSLVGGGSEMFVRKRGRFLADIPFCVQRIRERDQRNNRMIVDETIRAKTAESLNAELLAALKLAESFIAGFEGDDLQDGINVRLASIRAAIAKAEAA